MEVIQMSLMKRKIAKDAGDRHHKQELESNDGIKIKIEY